MYIALIATDALDGCDNLNLIYNFCCENVQVIYSNFPCVAISV